MQSGHIFPSYFALAQSHKKVSLLSPVRLELAQFVEIVSRRPQLRPAGGAAPRECVYLRASAAE